MDAKQFAQLIKPYEQHFDPTHQRHYFYEPRSKQSIWELPKEILDKIQNFYEQYKDEKNKTETESSVQQRTSSRSRSRSPNKPESAVATIASEKSELDDIQAGFAYQFPSVMDKHISTNQKVKISRRGEESVAKILQRPARKQVEVSLADKVAYKEGDQEYNIWYGRFLSDTRDAVRDHKAPAPTRCNSERDSGYTKADITDRYNSYFCHHWSKGCCAEGQNCRYYHRVPVLAECVGVDNQRDIFGRARHNKQREDRGGVGSFNVETRSIEVKDFKAPTDGVGVVTQMYEILYRHFSEWGDIEDIRYYPNQVKAIIRYRHRCMAEFAKDAMQHQALDRSEVINIKWFLENKDEENKERYQHEELLQLKRALERQQTFKTREEYNAHKEALKQQKRQAYLDNKRQKKDSELVQGRMELLEKTFAGEEEEEPADPTNQVVSSVANSFPQYGHGGYSANQNDHFKEYYQQQQQALSYRNNYHIQQKEFKEREEAEALEKNSSKQPEGAEDETTTAQ